MARLYVHGKILAELVKMLPPMPSGRVWERTYRLMEDGKVLKRDRTVYETGAKSASQWKIGKLNPGFYQHSMLADRVAWLKSRGFTEVQP